MSLKTGNDSKANIWMIHTLLYILYIRSSCTWAQERDHYALEIQRCFWFLYHPWQLWGVWDGGVGLEGGHSTAVASHIATHTLQAVGTEWKISYRTSFITVHCNLFANIQTKETELCKLLVTEFLDECGVKSEVRADVTSVHCDLEPLKWKKLNSVNDLWLNCWMNMMAEQWKRKKLCKWLKY